MRTSEMLATVLLWALVAVVAIAGVVVIAVAIPCLRRDWREREWAELVGSLFRIGAGIAFVVIAASAGFFLSGD